MNPSNKTRFIYFFISLLLLSSPYYAQAAGTIIGLEGEVYLSRGEGAKSQKIKLKDKVSKNDTIETKAKSKVKIKFEDNSILTLGDDTKIKIKDQVYSKKDNLRKFIFKAEIGKIRALVENASNKDSIFEIHTPTAIMRVKGTSFFITNVVSPKVTEIFVLEGEIFAQNIAIPHEITMTKYMTTAIVLHLPPVPPMPLTPQQIEKIKVDTEFKTQVEDEKRKDNKPKDDEEK